MRERRRGKIAEETANSHPLCDVARLMTCNEIVHADNQLRDEELFSKSSFSTGSLGSGEATEGGDSDDDRP